MMVCQNCGRRTFKGEKFCPKCGSPMPTERTSTEEDNDMNQRFRRFSAVGQNEQRTAPSTVNERPPYAPAPAETPIYNPAERPARPSEEVPPSVFVPEIEFKSVSQPTADPQASGSVHSDEQGFYGSYGAICNDAVQSTPNSFSQPQNDFAAQEFKPVYSTDVPSNENSISFDDFALPDVVKNIDEDEPFRPIIPDNDDDDELVLPDFGDRFTETSGANESKKSIGYEATVPLKDAHKADRNQQSINQPIPNIPETLNEGPKVKEFTAVASGTVKGKKGRLPELKGDQMYVALTPKEFRQLKSRKFRGLGIIATLCLVIISSFCIWSYANSFADPLVGRWKGNVSSQDIPIEAVQQMNQDIIDSTWEFGNSGSMYLNMVINDTPVSLSGTYKKQDNEKGDEYLSITLTNPMDGAEYTFDMYYTVTGKVLELNDMQGLGMEIDLVKE